MMEIITLMLSLGVNSRFNTAKEIINKLKDWLMKMIHTHNEESKNQPNKKKSKPKTKRSIKDLNIELKS